MWAGSGRARCCRWPTRRWWSGPSPRPETIPGWERAALVTGAVSRWGGSLPQYAVGHPDLVRRLRSSIDAVPGLAVAGAAYDGVGIAACLGSATAAADKITADLGTGSRGRIGA